MKISHQFYAFQKSKVLIQKLGFFVLIAGILISCSKELPIAASTTTDVLTNSKGQLVKTNGIPNGGFTLDAGGQGSGVNSITGLSPLIPLYWYNYSQSIAAPAIYITGPLVPSGFYRGSIYGQDFLVRPITWQIYPSTPLGTPVSADTYWLEGSDVGKANSLVYSGQGSTSAINDGKFAFNYSLFTEGGYTTSTTTQMFIPDPSFSGIKTADGQAVTMFNPNFLETNGGGTQVIFDSAKIVCDGKGGFAFAEVGWSASTTTAPPTGTVLIGIARQQNSYTIKMYAPDPQSIVPINNPQPISSIQVLNSQNQDITLSVRRVTLSYYGDINDITYMNGNIVLSDGTKYDINTSWIAP